MTSFCLTTNGTEQAHELGSAIGEVLRGGDLVDLRGDLGAGKTTTTVGIAKSLGVTSTVRSPTFTFLHHHRCTTQVQELLHVDLYRVDHAAELEGLGLFDLFDDDTVVVVEWMERAGGQLPAPNLTVELVATGETARAVVVQIGDDRAEAFLQALGRRGLQADVSGPA